MVPGPGIWLALSVNGGTVFPHRNSLGSATVYSDWKGSEVQDAVFYSWGQEWLIQGNVAKSMFASLPDYDGNYLGSYQADHRSYSTLLGRWMTPDPAGLAAADPANPQSWNRYAYVLNNPTNLADPLGLRPCSSSASAAAKASGHACIGSDSYDDGGLDALPLPRVCMAADPLYGPCSEYHISPWWYQNGDWGDIFAELWRFVLREERENRQTRQGGGGGGAAKSEPQSPQTSTPAQAATSYCQEHGQLSFDIPFTHIPVTIGFSGSGLFTFSSTNDIGFTFPPSVGASLDITVDSPTGPNIPVQAGYGKNTSVGTFLTPSGPKGFSLSIGPTFIGSPITISPTVANACGLNAGGG